MASSKPNYYEVLGLNQSATAEELRRAYRILARRYHPDLNPGKSSEERFKIISLAYQTLSDASKKRNYDAELDSQRTIRAGFAAYERAQSQSARATSSVRYSHNNHTKIKAAGPSLKSPNREQNLKKSSNSNLVSNLANRILKVRNIFSRKPTLQKDPGQEVTTSKVSVIEVSITMQDALFGGRKSVEIPGDQKNKKISLKVPAGVRTGSVLRLRSGTQHSEDFVIILRVAPHPLAELLPKGVLIDVPITIYEALFGASIKVPGLEEQESIIIPSGSQSGQEIRLSGKGVKFEDGRRGDIFYRLNIQIPLSAQAVGLKEKISAVCEYYESPVRQGLAISLKSDNHKNGNPKN